MNTHSAIVLGATIVAAAIAAQLFYPRPHYQLSYFQPGVVARLNTESGAIELCGEVESVMALMPHGLIDDMRRAGLAADQVNSLIASMGKKAIADRCFQINDGAADSGDH